MQNGKAHVTIRAWQREKRRVVLAGGFLEVGEHPADGYVREIKEELWVEAQVVGDSVLQATHTYGEGGDWVLAIGFRVRITGGEIRPADDVADVRWVSLGEIDDLDFAWAHDRELVRAALRKEDA